MVGVSSPFGALGALGSGGGGGTPASNRKYLCAAPRPDRWDDFADSILNNLATTAKGRQAALQATLDKIQTLHPLQPRIGPGRKSNAEHAVAFYQYLLDKVNEELEENEADGEAKEGAGEEKDVAEKEEGDEEEEGSEEEDADDDEDSGDESTTSSSDEEGADGEESDSDGDDDESENKSASAEEESTSEQNDEDKQEGEDTTYDTQEVIDIATMPMEQFISLHNDVCDVCEETGNLLLCGTCNLVFHLPCVRPVMDKMPPDMKAWKCAYCFLAMEPKNSKPRKQAAAAVRLMARLRNQNRRNRARAANADEEEEVAENPDSKEKPKSSPNEEIGDEASGEEGKEKQSATGKDGKKKEKVKHAAKGKDKNTGAKEAAREEEAVEGRKENVGASTEVADQGDPKAVPDNQAGEDSNKEKASKSSEEEVTREDDEDKDVSDGLMKKVEPCDEKHANEEQKEDNSVGETTEKGDTDEEMQETGEEQQGNVQSEGKREERGDNAREDSNEKSEMSDSGDDAGDKSSLSGGGDSDDKASLSKSEAHDSIDKPQSSMLEGQDCNDKAEPSKSGEDDDPSERPKSSDEFASDNPGDLPKLSESGGDDPSQKHKACASGQGKDTSTGERCETPVKAKSTEGTDVIDTKKAQDGKEESQSSVQAKGSTTHKPVERTPGGFRKRKLELKKIESSLSPGVQADLLVEEAGRGKRFRKQTTLYDPQFGPARKWQSDDQKSEGFSEPETQATATASDDKKKTEAPKKEQKESTGCTPVDDDCGKNPKSILRQTAGTTWCSFCKDDLSITVCVFCACRVCFGKHHQDKLLLCDNCNDEYHTFCLNPPLKSVPTAEKWFCPTCVTAQETLLKASESSRKSPKRNSARKASSKNKEPQESSIPTAAAAAAAESPKKKKKVGRPRGRPRIHPIPTSSPKRKRGRPKSSTTSSKRGRPKKSSSKSARAAAVAEETNKSRGGSAARPSNKQKKSAGRGAGSSAAASSAAAVAQAIEVSATMAGNEANKFFFKSSATASAAAAGTSFNPSWTGQVAAGASASSIMPPPPVVVKKSRSGRTVKPSTFHDEIYEGAQHLRSNRYAVEMQRKAAAAAAAEMAASPMSTVEETTTTSTAKVSSPRPKTTAAVPLKAPPSSNRKKCASPRATLTPTDIPLPSSVEASLHVDLHETEFAMGAPSLPLLSSSHDMVAPITAAATTTTASLTSTMGLPSDSVAPPRVVNAVPAAEAPTVEANTLAGGSASAHAAAGSAPLPVGAVDPAAASFASAAAPSAGGAAEQHNNDALKESASSGSRAPRRKPGARECMQISRRFGVNVIPAKYMEILLDYCKRGKVEHLIRMRERLDEHSLFLEAQLAGLEALVKEKGESDVVVPAAPQPPDKRAQFP